MKMLLGHKLLGIILLVVVLILDHLLISSHVITFFGLAAIILLISDGLVEVVKVLKKK